MKIRDALNPIYVIRNKSLIKPVLIERWKIISSFCQRRIRSFGIPVTSNDRRVLSLKNKHKGQRCFIIGSGPSLKISDLDMLKNEVTFACNKIYLAFNDTDWRPTYYSVLDVLVAENNKDVIKGLNLCKIFHEGIKSHFMDSEDIVWVKGLREPIVEGNYEGKFSINALEGVYGGWTVIYPQIQLAYYMGIREIYLLGVDFSFDIPKPTGKVCLHGEVLEHGGEINHFHPDYRKSGETWTMPKLDLQYKAFIAARRATEKHGGFIINASRKTKLDVFKCESIDQVLKKD